MNIILILAGGSGTRAGGPLPKQFRNIKGRRMVWCSVDTFKTYDPECLIIIAVRPDFLNNWEKLFGEEEAALGVNLIKVEGGYTRVDSVKNCLNYLKNNKKEILEGAKIFIHDAARPFVSDSLIRRGADVVEEGIGAVPVIPVTDSLRKINGDSTVTVNRSDYVAVQTPQIFMASDIMKAYDDIKTGEIFTDDASVAEHSGLKIKVFPGDPINKKITNPDDFFNC